MSRDVNSQPLERVTPSWLVNKRLPAGVRLFLRPVDLPAIYEPPYPELDTRHTDTSVEKNNKGRKG